MLSLPGEIMAILETFAREFRTGVWERAIVLLVGAIVTPGQRTVSSALRVMGLQDEADFQNYHRVLNRADWASRHLGQDPVAIAGCRLRWAGRPGDCRDR